MEVPGTTVNRLCGSSMDAIGIAARAIKSGETSLMIAGGVESMSRAPFVMAKADSAFSRAAKIEDTTIGWRFVNPLMKAKYGIDSMPETAENVAARIQRVARRPGCVRAAQPAARGRRHRRRPARRGDRAGDDSARRRATRSSSTRDEHPRETTLEALAKLKGVVRPDGTVTAGNASGVNDGACALLIASADAARNATA